MFQRPPRPPDLEAEITAAPTDQGGRESPLFSGYRPDHDFGHSSGLNCAIHEYPGTGKLEPGESGVALLWLLVPEFQVGRMFTGMKFTVQEGRRVVAAGVVTKVLNRVLERPGYDRD